MYPVDFAVILGDCIIKSGISFMFLTLKSTMFDFNYTFMIEKAIAYSGMIRLYISCVRKDRVTDSMTRHHLLGEIQTRDLATKSPALYQLSKRCSHLVRANKNMFFRRKYSSKKFHYIIFPVCIVLKSKQNVPIKLNHL